MADAFTSETYNALCRDAEGYLARGLAEQARELLLKATSLIGTRPRARSLLADSCMQLGLWGEAKSQLEALATLEVDNIYTHFRLGQVLEETREYELARDNFRVVLDMNPDHHGAKVSLTRLEKLTEKPQAAAKHIPVEGQQIFADSEDSNGVFAGDGESSGAIDDLLDSIGMGEKRDVPGVEDLLNSIGIAKEKKEEKPKVDFGSIFGGSAPREEVIDQSPLSSVFGKQNSNSTEFDTSPDLNALFGGRSDTTVEPAVPDEESEAVLPDLLSMFGGNRETSDVPSSREEEEPESAQTDLSAMFGGIGETPDVPRVHEEQEPESASADLNAMFGASVELAEEPAVLEEEPETAQADLSAMFGDIGETPDVPRLREEEEPESAQADLSAMFGDIGEPPDIPRLREEEEPESASADLNAMFGISEELAEEPAVQEEEPESAQADLSAMFGAVEEPAEEPAVQEEEPESAEADLSAMFGAVEEPAEEPAVQEEEPESAEADLSTMFGASEESEEEPAVQEAQTEHQSEEEPPVEIFVVVPVIESETDDYPEKVTAGIPEPVEQSVNESSERTRYSILTGDSSSLCSIKLDAGRIRVIAALVAATDRSVSLDGDILSGKGLIWMGQGYLTPVVLSFKEGMIVRIDRLAARPDGVTHEACGIASVPSLCRLKQNGNENQILLFVSGRLKKIAVSPGLRIRASSLVAADPQVSLADSGLNFLSVTGKGTVIITG